MRLIDADALFKEFEKTAWYNNADRDEIAEEILLQMPTIDAVEVVRCKDCVGKAQWYKNDYGCAICGLSGLFVVEDNDFCSYGERKDDE